MPHSSSNDLFSSPRRRLCVPSQYDINRHLKRRSISLDNLTDYTIEPVEIEKRKLGHTVSLTSNRFKVDSPTLSFQKLDKLCRKREKTKEELIQQLGIKDENVREFLKTAENPAESVSNNPKIKLNFEQINHKANTNIQLLQKKLDKYQQQIKEIEDNGVTGSGNRIIKVVQHSVQSGTSSIADVVSKPLESINNFIKKEKKTRNSNSITENEDEHYLSCYQSMQSASDDECYSSSSPRTDMLENISWRNPAPEKREDDIWALKWSVEKIEKENEEAKEIIGQYKERLTRVLQSLQKEQDKREQLEARLSDLYNQWNDSTELHQNEMTGMKEEMDRALENIECVEYRFTGRTADIEEDVESCIARLSKLETQQQQQHQPIHTFLNIDAKIHLSKIFSFIIYLVVVVVVIAVLPLKFILSSKVNLIASAVSVVVFLIIWKCSECDLGIYYYFGILKQNNKNNTNSKVTKNSKI